MSPSALALHFHNNARSSSKHISFTFPTLLDLALNLLAPQSLTLTA
jgi:hypothetical protein